ncbi:conserved hypothetical protein [Hirschia baltica ATCC 49814]|uniref:DUF4238 domain-containing protein n=2 Tax=Hirschia TaxID=2723 RepID=C6XNF9_HIRBI|nr:conserved hypothetical protein [Hirschia baltica ATCC 49814]
MLWVYDFARDKSFRSKPRGVGAQKDFNRIDIQDYPGDAVETAMSLFENEVETGIKKVVRGNGFFETNDDFNIILNFIALLAVRNPAFREQRREFRQRVSEGIMDVVLSSPHIYESEMKRVLKKGSIEQILPYERMQDFHRRKEYTFEVAREGQIREEFELQDSILKVLGSRPWTIIRSNPDAGEFITCDHPVMLRPSGPEAVGKPLGFGLKVASIIFPLSKYVCVISDFDIEQRVIQADKVMVGSLNREVVLSAKPQLYASNDAFLFFDPISEEPKVGAQLSSVCR